MKAPNANCSHIAPFSRYLWQFRAATDDVASVNKSGFHHLIFGDDSASTWWDNSNWRKLHQNFNLTEPRVTTADMVHHINPVAKIIVILRDPADRLYSDYLYFHNETKNARLFHLKVVTAIKEHEACVRQLGLRSCVYLPYQRPVDKIRLQIGIYHVHLEEWLRVFPKEQMLILKLEAVSRDLPSYMDNVFSFLNIEPMPAQLRKQYQSSRSHLWINKKKYQHYGRMKRVTRDILNRFYQPHNAKLAELLGEEFDFNKT